MSEADDIRRLREAHAELKRRLDYAESNVEKVYDELDWFQRLWPRIAHAVMNCSDRELLAWLRDNPKPSGGQCQIVTQ